MTDLKGLEKHLREGKLTRRELMSTAAKVGVGAAAASVMPMASVVGAQSKFPPRKVLWLTMVRTAFFVPIIVGEREAAEFYGWETQFNAPDTYTPEAVINIFMNYIEQKPDAIAFAYVQPKIFDTAIKKAQEAGIYLICFNTDSPGRKEQGLAFVGQNMFAAGIENGKLACQYGQKLTGKTEGTVCINIAIPGHSALEERAAGTKQGVLDYNKANGTNFATDVLATSTNEAEYIAKMEAKWTADGEKIVAFAGVDSMTFCIGLFYKVRNLSGKVAGGGFDLDDPILQAIKDGRLQWSIGQGPYSQGWVTSALIWQALERKIPANDYDTAIEIVDSTNIDPVIAREATWKEKAKEIKF